MAFRQFGQSRPQLPPDPRLQQDPNQVPDGGDSAAPGADATPEAPPERPVAPGDTGAVDTGDEATEAAEPDLVQQLEDILGVEIPEEMWEQINGLGGSKALPLAEKQVENKASVFRRFGRPKG